VSPAAIPRARAGRAALPRDLPPEQTSARWWTWRIRAAVAEEDEGRSNLRVTEIHYHLSQAMRAMLGADSGANFHSWAVWGSKKAGVTIRRKDFQQALRNGAFDRSAVGAAGGRLIAWLCGDAAGERASARPHSARGPGMRLVRRWVAAWAERTRARARLALRTANRRLLSITGGHTARFLETFHRAEEPDAARLARFLAGFRPGTPRRGGEDALREAYRRYHEALFEPDAGRRRELTYFGNVLIIYWEMTLLQPYFHRAIPRGPAAALMPYFSTYEVGARRLDMRRDVPTVAARGSAPPLARLEHRDLRAFLDRVVRPSVVGGRLEGTRIRPLIDPRRRLRYLFTLTRVLHADAAVVEGPCSGEEMAEAVSLG
jgi:hypothetical protein